LKRPLIDYLQGYRLILKANVIAGTWNEPTIRKPRLDKGRTETWIGGRNNIKAHFGGYVQLQILGPR
jgi:hypothetical protein